VYYIYISLWARTIINANIFQESFFGIWKFFVRNMNGRVETTKKPARLTFSLRNRNLPDDHFRFSCWSWFATFQRRVARFFLVQTYQNGKMYPKTANYNQTAVNYTKWPKNIPNGHTIYVTTFSISRPSKFYPNWIFCFKISHLATPFQRHFCVRRHLRSHIAS
jgi:hypothetical protein